MSRTLTIVIGVIAVFAMQHVPAPDGMTTFALGGFIGLVQGVVLGVAFVYGEWESKS
jgi:hypothetical protein